MSYPLGPSLVGKSTNVPTTAVVIDRCMYPNAVFYYLLFIIIAEGKTLRHPFFLFFFTNVFPYLIFVWRLYVLRFRVPLYCMQKPVLFPQNPFYYTPSTLYSLPLFKSLNYIMYCERKQVPVRISLCPFILRKKGGVVVFCLQQYLKFLDILLRITDLRKKVGQLSTKVPVCLFFY
jgi:hypothetical protein